MLEPIIATLIGLIALFLVLFIIWVVGRVALKITESAPYDSPVGEFLVGLFIAAILLLTYTIGTSIL